VLTRKDGRGTRVEWVGFGGREGRSGRCNAQAQQWGGLLGHPVSKNQNGRPVCYSAWFDATTSCHTRA
jgi:hypothetical protein